MAAPDLSAWQAFWADLNWGELEAEPGSGMTIPVFPPLWNTCGSGMFGTPCERMQATILNASLIAVAALNGGVLWPLPQPAANSATHATATVSGPAARVE